MLLFLFFDAHTLNTYNLMCERQERRVIPMKTNKEKIEEMLENSKSGTISVTQITAQGMHRQGLSELVKEEKIYRVGRGLYMSNEVWEDDFFLLQQKYKRGIFSHDTALYLLGYSDRTPTKYTMTFPQGYNAPSLKEENVRIKRVIPENYNQGIIEINSPYGNPIRVYSLERTLCDIVHGNKEDIQIINGAMKQYADSSKKNIYQLMKYAKMLRVQSKISHYMEVLL